MNTETQIAKTNVTAAFMQHVPAYQVQNMNLKQEPDSCESTFARSLSVNTEVAPQRAI